MIEIIKRVWLYFYPVRHDHGVKCYPWKLHMFQGVLISMLGLGAFIFVAYGGAEPHISGFVTSDKYTELDKRVAYLAKDRLDEKIADKHYQMCEATDGFKHDLQLQISKLRIQYFDLFGVEPYVEPCPAPQK
jgi:hypothetical protein